MSSSSVEQCELCADSMHDVHHAIVEVNVVIGVLVVHCELLLVRVVPVVVCDDAAVRRTLVLIAFTVAFVFIVSILRRILLYWRYSVYRNRRQMVPPIKRLCLLMLSRLRTDGDNVYPTGTSLLISKSSMFTAVLSIDGGAFDFPFRVASTSNATVSISVYTNRIPLSRPMKWLFNPPPFPRGPRSPPPLPGGTSSPLSP